MTGKHDKMADLDMWVQELFWATVKAHVGADRLKQACQELQYKQRVKSKATRHRGGDTDTPGPVR